MVADGHSRHHHHHEDLRWPEVTRANTIPTPYQIFNQKKGSKYSKLRFYELVKLYHPDRHDHAALYDGLSYETKLERYRLVVAANDILSDPAKRGAYDCYGAGWNGAPDVKRPQDYSGPSTPWGDFSGRGWAGGSQGPSQNATWEDWESWYQRDAKRPQEPVFVSNGAFVVLIVTFAILGGIGQFTRVGDYSIKFLAQRDTLHDEMSKELMRRRKDTATVFGSREERINSFLRQRDPVAYGMGPREETPRKLLPSSSEENIRGRPTDICHHKDSPEDG